MWPRRQPRSVLRRTFAVEQHLEALDNDADDTDARLIELEAKFDARHETLLQKIDRMTWAVVGLALTIAGSTVIYLITQGLSGG